MKYACILYCLLLGACKQPHPTAPATDGTTTDKQAPDWKTQNVYGSNADTARSIQSTKAPAYVEVPVDRVPKASESKQAYLCTGWWHLNAATSGVDSTIYRQYHSKWLKFKPDFTFDLLVKGRVSEQGRWAYDEEKNEIYLSCKDTYVNNSWAVMEKGFVMIWKGNTDINVTGIQIRVVCSKSQAPPIEN